MDTPQRLSKAMKWAIEVLNEGGDVNILVPEERSPMPHDTFQPVIAPDLRCNVH